MLNAVVASPMHEEPEAYFSSAPCDECDNEKAGLRYDIRYRMSLTGEISEASVCPDCYCKLCG